MNVVGLLLADVRVLLYSLMNCRIPFYCLLELGKRQIYCSPYYCDFVILLTCRHLLDKRSTFVFGDINLEK
jgi:hypothetical protein